MTKELDIIRPDFSELRGWDALHPHEQTAVDRETQKLIETVYGLGMGRLRLGEHLARVRDVLEPHGMFTRYLRLEGLRVFRLSRATAYRHIGNYERARTILPPPVVKLALMRDMDTIDAALIEAFPPPRSSDPEVIGPYLDKISSAHKAAIPDGQQAELAMRECYHMIRTRYERLPQDARGRTAWMHELIGLQLTMLGVGSQQQLGPVAVPESFRPQPIGRPRKQA